ncbi:MAG: glycosyl hydrolase [Thermoguttaceae bacterium]
MKRIAVSFLFCLVVGFTFCETLCAWEMRRGQTGELSCDQLAAGFAAPPDYAKPGVYWYFMDGNMNAEAMTKDLESMKKVGIAHLIFLEVNIGIPRGKVDMLSEQWLKLWAHAVAECERLGIEITLGIGPGWTGSGGPWVKPEDSMQHLVASTTQVTGTGLQTISLPTPPPKRPYFGEGTLSPELKSKWLDFYEDVAVLAFPTPKQNTPIADIDEKALYYRAPYSSVPGVRPFFETKSEYTKSPNDSVVAAESILVLTDKMKPDGTLTWDVPAGDWTVMRFGRRNNGAVTRPAPIPGLGFECSKFDADSLDRHLDSFVRKMFAAIGKDQFADTTGGLKMIHMDSWEMGAQNWSPAFRAEFEKRRGYDPLPYFPAYAGVVVNSAEQSERFLWDLRTTAQELVFENHAQKVHKFGHEHGLGLSIEPYDMNPTCDIELAMQGDVPMAEFWGDGCGFDTAFGAAEATSASHLLGQPVVPAEAFTSYKNDGWQQNPSGMKNQTDWAFAAGINRFVFHTFQHQPLDDSLKPGMTMAIHGAHWNRNQTWWDLVPAYHDYVSRSQFLLQQGRTVADLLLLVPEGAPHVFRPPTSLMSGDPTMPDRRGYNFDACPPSFLAHAKVENGNIVFPSGATYRVLGLPVVETMTPELLTQIARLVAGGATVIGVPPKKSPSLENFPQCDERVAQLTKTIWQRDTIPDTLTETASGRGRIFWDKTLLTQNENLYPNYDYLRTVMEKLGVPEDFFTVMSDTLRYTHRTSKDWDIYFVSNRTGAPVETDCLFRLNADIRHKPAAFLWDANTGERRVLNTGWVTSAATGKTLVMSPQMQFAPHQSFFVVFPKDAKASHAMRDNFPKSTELETLGGAWNVAFDPQWGGPENVVFDSLLDWTTHSDSGVKYYSGKATYTKKFSLSPEAKAKLAEGESWIYLDLGRVENMASVRLNGKELGVVWSAPWRVDVTDALNETDNVLEITVANLWCNRVIGDEIAVAESGASAKTYTFSMVKFFTKDSPLFPSGLLGPVTLVAEESP